MIQIKKADIEKSKPEILFIPVCEDRRIHRDPVLEKLVKLTAPLGEFEAKPGEEAVFYRPAPCGARRVALLGIGKSEEINGEVLRKFAGKAVGMAIGKKLTEAWIAVPNLLDDMASGDVLKSVLEGAILGNYIFEKYKGKKKKHPLKKIVLTPKPEDFRVYQSWRKRIETVCRSTLTARDWVTRPGNEKRPETWIREIAAAGRKAGLKTTVFSEKSLRQRKFGGMLAVGAGSQSPPGLVILEHKPRKASKRVVLVGKGVTFDSGGINLKPSQSLDEMKIDMAGAAAVASTLVAAAESGTPLHLIGLIPVVENMPSGTATRPGDVISIFGGKTVEIGNTDAEGRLILADAMAYAIKHFKPDILIDVATLTGACMIALGDKIAGLFTPDDDLAEMILESAETTGERCWRLPLPDDYTELIRSEIADVRNLSSSRWGGAITAALFLKEFANDARWAHLDIAGPANLKKAAEYCPAGGTGYGVRLLSDLIDRLK